MSVVSCVWNLHALERIVQIAIICVFKPTAQYFHAICTKKKRLIHIFDNTRVISKYNSRHIFKYTVF